MLRVSGMGRVHSRTKKARSRSENLIKREEAEKSNENVVACADATEENSKSVVNSTYI